jgi:hypothetical protein
VLPFLTNCDPGDETAHVEPEPDFRVIDCNGVEVKVGTRVVYGDCGETFCARHMSGDKECPQVGTVESISEPDADYDDDLERGVVYPPRLIVRFPDGEWEEASSHNIDRFTWSGYPDGPAVSTWLADDIEVA